MIIVEFSLDHPILRETLQSVPEMRLRWERSDPFDDHIRVLLWAEGGDFGDFEEALEDDPTVSSPLRTIDVDDRRLYELDLVEQGRETSVYPLMIEEGGIIHELTATREGWKFRAGFPDRDSFRRFDGFCRDHGIEMDVHQVYEQRAGSDNRGYGLTESQREILLAAIDCGYFDIPRGCSLSELAERLDISQNAASERLRRAMDQLVERTVYPGNRE